MADVNWKHGTLVTPPTPDAPGSIGDDDSVAALLDEAEDIINNAGPSIRAEVDAERSRKIAKERKQSRWWPFGRK